MILQGKYTAQQSINETMFYAKEIPSKRKVIVKTICYKNMLQKQKQKLIFQINTLTSHKSNHIIKYLNFINDKKSSQIYIIMDYFQSNKNLEYIISHQRNQCDSFFQEKTIWDIFANITIAIYEIHNDKKGTIIHRNIRPSSIIINKGQAKLGDFGFAKRINSEQNFAETFIQQKYLSPQQITQGIFTIQTDIWALGCLLFELTTLKEPFSNENQFQRIDLIKNRKVEEIPVHYSRQLNRVIQWCLQKNYKDRPTTKQMISIPEVNIRLRQYRISQNERIYEKKKVQVQEREEKIKIMKKYISQLQNQRTEMI